MDYCSDKGWVAKASWLIACQSGTQPLLGHTDQRLPLPAWETRARTQYTQYTHTFIDHDALKKIEPPIFFFLMWFRKFISALFHV